MKSHRDFAGLVRAFRELAFSTVRCLARKEPSLREGFLQKIAIMREKKKANFYPAVPFTRMMLEQLKGKGYKFLQIKGYAHNNRIDYIQPYYLMLIPFKEFPKEPHDIEIYEPINSEILSSWADDEMGVKVMVFHDNRSCL